MSMIDARIDSTEHVVAKQPNPAPAAPSTQQSPGLNSPSGANPGLRDAAQQAESKGGHESSLKLPHGPKIKEAQELLLESVREDYLKSIRKHYLNKSPSCKNEQDVMRIAHDGIQGVATNEAIEAARTKFGLPAGGGLDNALLAKLREARGKHGGKDGKAADKGGDDPAKQEAADRKEKVQAIGSLINHEKSPAEVMKIIRYVRQTQGEEGVTKLMDDFKKKNDGRSIIEEMAKERDLDAGSVADCIVELDNGKTTKAAAELAVKTYRLLDEDGRFGRHAGRDRQIVRGMLEEHVNSGGKIEDVSRVLGEHMSVRHQEDAARDIGEEASKDPKKLMAWLMRDEQFILDQAFNIGQLIDREKSPTEVGAIVNRVTILCGEEGRVTLNERFKEMHHGRSIVQEMAKEKDLKVTDIADFVMETYGDKYKRGAAITAIENFRRDRKAQWSEIQTGTDTPENNVAKDLLGVK